MSWTTSELSRSFSLVRLPMRREAVVFADVGQAGNPINVDDIFRNGQLQLHQRDEALASGQHHGFGAEPVKQGNRLIQRLRGKVLELGWYHGGLLFGPIAHNVSLTRVNVNSICHPDPPA